MVLAHTQADVDGQWQLARSETELAKFGANIRCEYKPRKINFSLNFADRLAVK